MRRILFSLGLSVFVLALLSTSIEAGPNAGGVLVVHSSNLTYTVDTATYIGQSGVACGQDGPDIPYYHDCPPYDPIGGADPCEVSAANPTSAHPADEPQVWFVLAAFPDSSCPRLKALAFGFNYDEARLGIIDFGSESPIDPDLVFELLLSSSYDDRPFPAPGAGVALSFTFSQTSHLQELYWFAGYAYAGSGDARFDLIGLQNPANNFFIDDSAPGLSDPIRGYGHLGFLGTIGSNPTPVQGQACCIEQGGGDAICIVHTAGECIEAGGVASPRFYCDPAIPDNEECGQPPPGSACCLPGGLCQLMTPIECANAGGFAPGSEVDCAPNPCAIAQACCFDAGSCLLLTPGDCVAEGGEYVAGNCVPNPCIHLPDIAVTPDSLDFETVLISASKTLPVSVANRGDAVLTILSLVVAPGVFTTEETPFSLVPGQTRAVSVTFTPQVEGVVTGNLRIVSDDPDEPETNVALRGEGAWPGDIAVLPDTLFADLVTDQQLVRDLWVMNNGVGDISWTITLGESTSRGRLYELPGRTGPAHEETNGTSDRAIGDRSAGPLSARLEDLNGTRVIWDRAHGQIEGIYWSTILADLSERGADVAESFDALTPELLSDADLYWTTMMSQDWTDEERQALQSWVRSGGSILLEAPAGTTAGYYQALLNGLDLPLAIEPNGSDGFTSNIHAHVITQEVYGVYLNSTGTHLEGGGVQPLVSDLSGELNVACAPVGMGRVLVAGSIIGSNYAIGYADNRRLLNQAVDWLAATTWVRFTPLSGLLEGHPPDDDMLRHLVRVTFDATDLFGGDYETVLRVRSNDPDEAEIPVVARLHVTGAPDLVVEPVAIDFGQVYQGFCRTDTIRVTNGGTDLLSVTALTAMPADYQVDGGGFTLSPGQSRLVEVGFCPGSLGSIPGRLDIASNDPDAPLFSVELDGTGVIPPDLVVQGGPFEADLYPGGTDVDTLVIGNAGGADLDYRISASVGEVDLGVGLRQRFWPPASGRPLEPRRTHDAGPPPARTASNLPTPAWQRSRDLPWRDEVVFFDDMENGPNGWTQVAYSGPPLWHQTERWSASPIHSWWCGVSWDWTYDTDERVNTALVSPPIDLSGAQTRATLAFFESYETEPTWDLCMVDVSLDDGGHWSPLRDPVSGVSGGWVQSVLDLSSYVGSVIRIRFHFDTTDEIANYYHGWMIDDVLVTGIGVGWLSFSPNDGTVPPGENTEVQVTFDASNLPAGEYTARLQVESNDPDGQTVELPARMRVADGPALVVVPAALEFGPVFVSASRTDTLRVGNEGTEPLIVTGTTLSPDDYTADGAGFTLPPGESRSLQVTFAPAAIGVISGTLSFISNDPDEPVKTVTLTGEGILPPDVSVSPESLYAELLTEEVTTRTLTIENQGGSDLTWDLSVRGESLLTRRSYVLTAPPVNPTRPEGVAASPDRIDVSDPRGEIRTTPIRARLADLSGVKILWDQSHGQPGPWSWTTILTDLVARGATYTDSYAPITAELLSDYGILWLESGYEAWAAPEIDAVRQWVRRGGRLLLEGDNYTAEFDLLLAALGLNARYQSTWGAAELTSNIHPHETTAGVDQIYLSYPAATLQSIGPPEVRLVDDTVGRGVAVCAPVGAGQAAVLSTYLLGDWSIGVADNQLFGNQLLDWLAGPSWVSAEPVSGAIPAGGRTDVTVTFDATGRFGGDYAASLAVTCNDPDEPVVSVAARMQVTGVPRITVTPEPLDFGPVFLTTLRSDTVTVYNSGTDALIVTGLTVGTADFSVEGSGFELPPGGSQRLIVTFAPQSPGPVVGELAIASNDPDEPILTLMLQGTGITPPEIEMSPLVLSADLLTNQAETQILLIANLGASDLIFQLSVQEDPLRGSSVYELPPAVAASERPPRSNRSATPPSMEPPRPPMERTTPLFARLQDLSNLRVLWDRSHGQSGTWSWTTILGDLALRGATVTERYDSITSGLLAEYDLLWIVPGDETWSAAELVATADWVHAGGGLLLAGDWDPTAFNAILEAVGTGVWLAGGGVPSEMTTNVHPHAITTGVNQVYLDYAESHLVLQPPAVRLVDNSAGLGIMACAGAGVGRVVVMTDQLTSNWSIGYGDNRLLGNQAIDWLAAPQWLTMEPSSGTIAAGGTLDVAVTFHATGLATGDYAALLRADSNDPSDPQGFVRAQLHVTGVADIAVEPDALGFGAVYLTTTRVDTVTIRNDGAELLTVTGLTVSPGSYQVDPAPFTVPPRGSHPLSVSFAPQTAGVIPGTLEIVSDDPDEPTVIVSLLGEGVPPPDIALSPSSFAAELPIDGMETQSLTVANEGQSDLAFTLSVVNDTTRRKVVYALTAPRSEVSPPPEEPTSAAAGEVRTTPIAARLADLSGVRILWDRSHGQSSGTAWSVLLTDLVLRGATVTELSESLSPSVLSEFDILWLEPGYMQWSAAELTAIEAWVRSGGGLLLEGDSYIDRFNELLSGLNSGISYTSGYSDGGYTTNIHPHEITAGVGEIYLSFPQAYLTTIGPPAVRLVEDGANNLMATCSPLGGGRLVVLSANLTVDWYVGYGDNQLFGNQMVDWLAGPQWLSVTPEAGQLTAGESMDVQVTFQASGLLGGEYAAALRAESNDPDGAVVLIPAALHVIGIPDVAAAPDPLRFEEVFLGASRTDTLWIGNDGTDLLTVTALGASPEDFQVDDAAFTLPPGESRAVLVTFLPSAAGPAAGTLAITSDDPDEPVLSVGLSGIGVLPPDIAVSPRSLSADLLTNQTSTQALTIANDGATDLTFALTVLGDSSRRRERYELTPPRAKAPPPDGAPLSPEGSRSPRPPSFRTDPIGARLSDLNGVRILWDRTHGQTALWNWTVLVTDLTARGGTVIENFDPISPELLATVDILWTVPGYTSWSASEVTAVADWVRAGGGLLTEGDYYCDRFNVLLASLEVDLAYAWSGGGWGYTANIYPHETTVGVASIYLDYTEAQLTGLTGSAVRLIDDSAGRAVAACARAGIGRVVALAELLTADYAVGYADNQLFGNQVIDWLAGPQWLSVEPDSGTVLPGSAAEVAVTLDAHGLGSGDYAGLLRVESNDPDEPMVDVTARLHVTGAPDIALEPDSLDFGPTYLTSARTETLVVRNDGSERLSVSGLVATPAEFQVDGSGFVLSPGASVAVPVTFTPTAAGIVWGALEIASDDPDEPLRSAALRGEGVPPPEIDFSPDSLFAALNCGDSSDQTLTLRNTGASDLEVELAVEYVESPPDGRAPEVEAPPAEPREAGGPDLFGYRWIDSRDPDGPVLNWIDTGTGTTLHLQDDSFVTGVPLGFTFRYYDQDYSQIAVTSNGWLTFGEGAYWYPWAVPSADGLSGVIAPFARNLDFGTGGSVRYLTLGSAPERRFVVTYNQVHFYEATATFQVVLYEGSNVIRFQYLAAPQPPEAWGIESSDESTGLGDGGIGDLYIDPGWVGNGYVLEFRPRLDWLKPDPVSALLPPGGQVDVAVTFDARGVFGGDYAATVRVSSNDPDEPVVEVPARMVVTGVPDVAVRPDPLDFGPVYLTASRTDTLEVWNEGTDRLTVSGVSVSPPDYAADSTGFVLSPGRVHRIPVTFAPTEAGAIPGTLRIESDDPDEPSFVAGLAGEGVPPPDIRVEPAALSADLFTGQTETQVLTLGNEGLTDLVWASSLESVVSRPRRLYELTPPKAGAEPSKRNADAVPTGEFRTASISAELADLTGVRILWDRRHGQPGPWSFSVIIADLVSRGATVTQNFAPISSALLADFDIVWTERSSSVWNANELESMRSWVRAGGNLLMETDSYPEPFNAILASLGAEISYAPGYVPFELTSRIYPHPITRDVDELEVYYSDVYLGSTSFPAILLVDDEAQRGLAACSGLGAGRIVTLCGFLLGDWMLGYADNQLFGNQAVDWLAGPAWVSAEPTSGTVPPGGSEEIAVDFNAAGLFTGDYAAIFEIRSNDPDEPVVPVPLQLHATGLPEIAVEPDTLEFGPVYLTATRTDTVWVRNEGTEILTVTAVAASPSAYTADAGGFEVGIGDAHPVPVTFAPQAEGPAAGVLAIECDDPDETVVSIALWGIGVPPPDIDVQPSELSADLTTGEISMQAVTIANHGVTELDFEVTRGHVVAQPRHLYNLTAPLAGAPGPPRGSTDSPVAAAPAAAGEFRTTPMAARLADLSGVRILWDQSHGQPDTQYWSVMVSDLVARGATFTLTFGPITAELLAEYDILWVPQTYYPWAAAELAALSAWLRDGGSLYLEGSYWIQQLNAVLASIGEELRYTPGYGGAGITTDIHPHEITAGVGEIYLNDRESYLGTVAPPSTCLVSDLATHCVAACADIDQGRIFVAADYLTVNSLIGYGDNQLFGNQLIDWLAGPRWLTVDPVAGTVAPGGQIDLAVTFDAQRLYTGDYAAVLQVTSNDPDEPRVDVLARMHVSGIPDAAVEPDTLEFGSVYLTATRTDTVFVENVGTGLLTIAELNASPAEFQVEEAGFAVPPGERHPIPVTFVPSLAGPVEGSLAVTSDDPDAPVLVVLLRGEGVPPPEIVVSPDSIFVELPCGGAATRAITIANEGTTELSWAASARAANARPKPVHAGSPSASDPSPPSGLRDGRAEVSRPDARVAGRPDSPAELLLSELTGVRILWDRSHGQPSGGSYWSLVLADLVARGAIVTENDDPITPALLAPYDLLWTEETPLPWSAAQRAAISDWVRAGGGLLMEGDSYPEPCNELLSELEAGIVCIPIEGSPGLTSNIYPHEITTDVGSIYLDYPVAYLGEVASPAVRLVDDATGLGNSACARIGAGRLVVISDEVLSDYAFEIADNRRFGNQAIDWLAGPTWLTLDPNSGTVPPGGSVEALLTIEPRDLVGGEYAAFLSILSNDPDDPVVDLPVRMHLIGIADIAAEPDPLEFGPVYVSAARTDTVWIRNQGTDYLTITGLAATPAEFEVTDGEFVLAPGATTPVPVTFRPSAPGAITGGLEISSDDPDEGLLTVTLSGEGAPPPEITVTPDSFLVVLAPGESTNRILTIGNLGEGDLSCRLAIGYLDLGGGVRRRYWPAPSAVEHPTPVAHATAPGGDASPATWSSQTLDQVRRLQGREIPVFFDDMEGGPNGWMSMVLEGADLWHQTHRSYASPTTSWWCGIEEQGNYQSGGRVNTAVVTPPIDLVNAQPPITLLFLESYETEVGWDGCAVEVSVDGGSQWDPLRPGVTGSSFGWMQSALDLTSYLGRTIQIRFHFDTIDPIGNSYPGWFVDDVVVTRAGVAWLSVEPESLTVLAGETGKVTLRLDASLLESGEYHAGLEVASNDPDEPLVAIPVGLSVSEGGREPEAGVETERAEIPAELLLQDAVPNPFRRSAEIRFGLPREALVRLTIFDLSGRTVRLLQEGRLPAGMHRLSWDGRSGGGSALPAGLYLCRLEAEGRTLTRRILSLH